MGGQILIPTRAQVAAQQQALAIGASAFSTPGWNGSVNDAIAVTGRYGLLSLVPTTMPSSDLTGFTTVTASQPTSYYNGLFPGFASAGNGWCVRSDGASKQWYYTNPYMAVQQKTASVIPLTNVAGAQVTISSDEHTSVIIQENPSNLGVHIFNYRLNLTNAISLVTDKPTTVAFGQNNMAPRLDSSGNPIINSDGSITTVGNQTLPDQTSRDVRTVALTIVGTWKGGQPNIVFADDPNSSRPYTHTTSWDAANKALTLTMNGTSAFNIQLDGGGPRVLPCAGWTVKYCDSQETNAEQDQATNVLDGDIATFWHTQWSNISPVPTCPHEVQLAMQSSHTVSGFSYLPRQDGSTHGLVGQYEFYVSADSTYWGTAVATGTFANDPTMKSVNFPAVTGRYVRLPFGKPIAELQGVQFMLADMGMKLTAARQLTYTAAAKSERGDSDLTYFGAAAKCFASDAAMEITTDAVQLLGGYGYTQDYPLDRMMRDAKITQIYEGTNQVQRVVMARQLLKG